jgi:hypothetical protein
MHPPQWPPPGLLSQLNQQQQQFHPTAPFSRSRSEHASSEELASSFEAFIQRTESKYQSDSHKTAC